MKKITQMLLILTLILGTVLVVGPGASKALAAPAQPAPQAETARPLLYIADYHTDYSGKTVSPWGSFGLTFTLGNNGKERARNIVMTFQSSVFDSLDGGVFTLLEVGAENMGSEAYTHHFKVNDMSTLMNSGTITATTTYTDPAGNPFSDTFTFTLTIDQPETSRPLLYIVDYHTDYSGKTVSPWGSFGLTFTLGNNGKAKEHARNIVMTFQSSVFDSLDGGVFTVFEVDAENMGNETHTHHFKVNDMSTWMYSGTITATTSYTDPDGNPFSDTFTFTLAIDQPATGGTSPTQTPTPAVVNRPQMVVNGYNTDIDPLQPGSAFVLTLRVGNVGNADARSVSLVYGGGATVNTDPQGTPVAGGVTGTGGDLTNFAPLGKSNVVLLGDVPIGNTQDTTQQFIVNVTTQPGAYPLKLSFVYTDPKGNRLVDDQVITLLVFSLPQLEISFYRTPDLVNVGNMTSLPIQITNLARKSVVLGNMTVTSDNADLTSNTILVGTLDPGGYFTFDPMFVPFMEGEVLLNFVINYTDDFNQLRTYNATLPIIVEPAMVFPTGEPVIGPDGLPVLDENGNPIYADGGGVVEEPVKELSFWARIWNAIKGFFGFGTETKPEETPIPAEPEIFPIAPGGKG